MKQMRQGWVQLTANRMAGRQLHGQAGGSSTACSAASGRGKGMGWAHTPGATPSGPPPHCGPALQVAIELGQEGSSIQLVSQLCNALQAARQRQAEEAAGAGHAAVQHVEQAGRVCQAAALKGSRQVDALHGGGGGAQKPGRQGNEWGVEKHVS